MRERYGFWAMKTLAVLLVLFTLSSVQAQIKYYPSLSLRNTLAYPPDGSIQVPESGTADEAGARTVLFPVFVYNEVDPKANPNVVGLNIGQYLEPIRSFEFELFYYEQAFTLDINSDGSFTDRGDPIVMVGPSRDAAEKPALAQKFYTRFAIGNDQLDATGLKRILRVSGASEVPLPLASVNTNNGTRNAANNAILLYIRFREKPFNAFNIKSGLLQLTRSRFNDHGGDPQYPSNFGVLLDSTTAVPPGTGNNWDRSRTIFTPGNFDPNGVPVNQGVGTYFPGQGELTFTPRPQFDFRPFGQLTPINNTTWNLDLDLVYDPSIPGAGMPQRNLQVLNAVGNSSLNDVSICTNQPWLFVDFNQNPQKQCIYRNAIRQAPVDFWIGANAAALQPGVYEGDVTFQSEGAVFNPVNIHVRLVRRRNPDEPNPGGGTGIRLTLTNSCVPACASTIVFGTGQGASAAIDPLFGETVFTENDRVQGDTNVSASSRCYAYFSPLDRNVDIQFQDPANLGTRRDIRSNLTDTTLLYKVVFSAGGANCYPVTICVDPTDFPEGARIIARDTLNGGIFSVNLREATQVDAQRCFVIRDPRITSFFIEYTPGTVGIVPSLVKNGWNLMSLPVLPPDPRPSILFPNASGNPFDYRESVGWTGIPRTTGALEFGRGYMLKFGDFIGTNDRVAGVRQLQIRGIRIDRGWNSVGALSVITAATGISFDPIEGSSTRPELQSDVFEFLTGSGYQPINYMIPGKGYFIKASAMGYYNLDRTNGKIAAATATQELMTSLASVKVSDASKNAQTLYFGNTSLNVNPSRFELPPTVFELDARFTSNKGFINVNQDSYTINLKAESYPLAMSFDNVQGEVEVRDLSGKLLGTAVNGSAVTINDRNVNQVVVAMKPGTGVNAQGFSLEQNFPNPFNPSTEIHFSIPSEMPVSLTVYNAMGQELRTLVNETKGAGRHVVNFDAQGLASGTYFYTLKAAGFVRTEKMTLGK